MAKLNSPGDLLIEELRDLYSAEQQLLQALPHMVRAANDAALKTAFDDHRQQTIGHVDRLEAIMADLDESPGGGKCLAMEGLLEEGKAMMEEEGEPAVLDLGLIAAAQKVEHYEIASYGSARALAELIDDAKTAQALQTTLDEEGAADKILTEIAGNLTMPAGVTEVFEHIGQPETQQDERELKRAPFTSGPEDGKASGPSQ